MLIKDVSLLVSGQLLKGRDVLVEENRITEIGRDLLADPSEETIDGHGKLAIPGLVNAHTHLAMTLFRGYADDMALMPWLQEKIWPLEARLTREDIHWGVKLGCLEMIRFGVTCYNDMYYFMDEAARATKEMGLRAFLSGVVFDSRPEFRKEAESFIKQWKGDDLISPAVGPHAVYTCSENTLLWAKEIAEKNDVLLHIHLSETRGEVEDSLKKYGKSPVEYLDSLGWLGPNLVAAHCVWLSDNDISLLARHKVNVAHCPVSNLKLAAGISPICDLQAAGVNVCLGTDGASSNNNLNLFEEMKVGSDGQLLNPNLHDYKVPTIADVPEIDAFFVGTADVVANHTGAKGLAEPPVRPGDVIRDAGQWVLCLQTYPRPRGEKYGNADSRIWIMRSSDLEHWSDPELLRVKGPDVPIEKMGHDLPEPLCLLWRKIPAYFGFASNCGQAPTGRGGASLPARGSVPLSSCRQWATSPAGA